jgi:hypothetical protein
MLRNVHTESLGHELILWYNLSKEKGRDLVGACSLTAAARKLARYKLDLVSVQEDRWDKGGTVREGDNFFYGKGNENHQLGIGFFCTPQNSVSR